MNPKLTKSVKSWLDNLKLPYDIDYFGGGFYGVSIQLNDDRYIVLTDKFGDTIPNSINQSIMASITNAKNEFWISIYSKNLRDFHIQQCY